MPEAPEVLAPQGMKVGRIDPSDIVDLADAATKRKFGTDVSFVKSFFRPYLYLDANAIGKAGLDQELVEQPIAEEILTYDGIALAVSMKSLPTLQNTATLERIRNNHHPARSGDVYVVQKPYWFLQEGNEIAVMHGSPWRYDTYVPIIFSGVGLRGRTVNRPVRQVDIAPTLAAVLGIKPPSSTSGEPLVEVLQDTD